jgi:hypothetical protein
MPPLVNTNLVIIGFLLGVIVILIVIVNSISKKKSDEIDSVDEHQPSATASARNVPKNIMLNSITKQRINSRDMHLHFMLKRI